MQSIGAGPSAMTRIVLQHDAAMMIRVDRDDSDLREAGMTHETMGLFPFTLYEWSTLGFSRTDAEAVPAHVLGRLFGMTKPDVLRCLV